MCMKSANTQDYTNEWNIVFYWINVNIMAGAFNTDTIVNRNIYVVPDKRNQHILSQSISIQAN